MRVDFVKSAMTALSEDAQTVFVTGDLGFNALEGLQRKLGTRFVNAGVAEQNMIGFAAGLALAGWKPWVYSIAPFATFRCLEQIRNDLCLHNLPVHLVGNGGGYTYGIMGSTHHALEDLAVLKAMPNMRLYFPCANDQVALAVDQMRARAGPTYLRLAVSPYNTALQPLDENTVTLTRQYARGPDWTVIGVGHAVQIALAAFAQHLLAEESVDIFGVARFPLDLKVDRLLVESVVRSRKVLVIDEHYQPGSIAESLKVELPVTERFEIMCASFSLDQRYGSSAFHLQQCGLTPERLLARIRAA